MPDGSSLAVLCKKVEQATTDVNGALGFGAALMTGSVARVWTYTYNNLGQLLTEADPLGHTTTYAYYTDTTSSHTKGDLYTVDNALHQKVTFAAYTPSGKILSSTDANAVVTTYSYDSRDRLMTTNILGLITQYAYWPTGQLKSVTMPDQTFVAYQYDDAHRLVGVSDALGNHMAYTLDNAGKVIDVSTTDPLGNLARQTGYIYDALSRVQQVTGRE
jgi:YD repeat-containing protein